jgi:hypothetical protein
MAFSRFWAVLALDLDLCEAPPFQSVVTRIPIVAVLK